MTQQSPSEPEGEDVELNIEEFANPHPHKLEERDVENPPSPSPPPPKVEPKQMP